LAIKEIKKKISSPERGEVMERVRGAPLKHRSFARGGLYFFQAKMTSE
jgi:hypothetical protein